MRDKVARVRARLPETIDEPVIAKVESDSFPIIWMAVAAGGRTSLEVSDYLTRYVKPRLSVLPGAADVRIFGERVTSMRINVDRDRLAAYALTSLDVENALRRQNLELPSGRIESAKREFSIVATTDVSTRDQFENLIIANVKGYPVRLRDVADVQVGAVSERVIARYNGKPSINMGLIKQAVANPLDLSKALREELARINPTLPPGMSISISYDSSVFIDRSIKSVFRTVAEAVVLVALVIFFFLRNLRATLIPLVTIPLALVGSFALMYAFGFTINTLTLLAMVLAIGLVVDDAIVVLENIYRNIEAGMDRVPAAIKGIKEIGFAVVAMTLTLTAVYAPLAFATGRTGRLFIEFALTLAGAVLVSGFVALTLSPMMCSKLLKHEEKHGRVFTMIEGWINGLTQGYARSLAWLLERRWIVVIVWFVTAGVALLFLSLLRSELAPLEDRGVIFGRMQSPPGATVDYTSEQLRPVEEVFLDDSGGGRLQRDRRVSVGRLRHRGAAAEAVGRAAAQAAGHRAPVESAAADVARRDRLRGQSAVARAVGPFTAGGIRDHGADAVCGARSHHARVHRRNFEDRHRADAAVGSAVEHTRAARRRQSRQAGRSGHPGRNRRPHAADDARRAADHALQERWRAVRRDRAGRAARPQPPKRHQRHLRSCARRLDGAACKRGQRSRRRIAVVVEPLSALARGDHHRQPGTGLHDRRCAEDDG